MDQDLHKLEHWIGQRIDAYIPMLNPESPDSIAVTLRGVDAGGIWIEADREPLSLRSKSDGKGAVTVFVPWSQIIYLQPPHPPQNGLIN